MEAIYYCLIRKFSISSLEFDRTFAHIHFRTQFFLFSMKNSTCSLANAPNFTFPLLAVCVVKKMQWQTVNILQFSPLGASINHVICDIPVIYGTLHYTPGSPNVGWNFRSILKQVLVDLTLPLKSNYLTRLNAQGSNLVH